ncbi:MAG TPA: hypothetical protein VF017_07410 [Thermoanaerobaculia bacterium]|nr:hypothetical protein [Thermoanaerobaculia bacterium]
MLQERISQLIAGRSQESFDTLALAAFAFQAERVEPLRALCRRRGIDPAALADWRQVPMVPTSAFKTLVLRSAPEEAVFRSSGTTQGAAARSAHYHGFLDLYRQTIDASFPGSCLPPGGAPLSILSLIPPRTDLPDSSLSFMIDHVLAHFGGPGTAVAFGARGLDGQALRSWCSARQRDKRPVLILATALSLLQALERLGRLSLRFRLPAGSVVFETGGFKGHDRYIEPGELRDLLEQRLGVPAASVVREYGMTELTSQCYTGALRGEDPELFVAPPWMRVRVLEPETLEEAPHGTAGLLALFDLANLSSAVHVLTEDLGVAEGGGFRLVGRAGGAELRGCSLAAEELAAGDR